MTFSSRTLTSPFPSTWLFALWEEDGGRAIAAFVCRLVISDRQIGKVWLTTEVRVPDTLPLNADMQTKWLKIILKENSQLGNKQSLHLVHARSERPSRKGTKVKFKMKGKEKEKKSYNYLSWEFGVFLPFRDILCEIPQKNNEKERITPKEEKQWS